MCHACTNTDTKKYQEERMEKLVQYGSEKLQHVKKLWSKLNTEKLELERKESSFKEYIGPTEKEFERILEHEIGVSRQEFHTGCWVGGHVIKIIMKSHLISRVLDKLPTDKENFDELCDVLKTLLPLTTAKRFLTEEELQSIETCCHKIGVLYPKTFQPCSITPKIHDLVFHLPRQARHFGTVGGVREDALEAMHANGNELKRRFASVKSRADKLRLMLQGFEAGLQMKARDLATPMNTRKKRKRALNRSPSTSTN